MDEGMKKMAADYKEFILDLADRYPQHGHRLIVCEPVTGEGKWVMEKLPGRPIKVFDYEREEYIKV